MAVTALQAWGRYQIVEREYLPNFGRIIVVALGQDGLVANTMNFDGQPLIGLNPSWAVECCCRSSPKTCKQCCGTEPQRPVPGEGGGEALLSDGQAPARSQ